MLDLYFPPRPFTKPDKVNTALPNPLPLILCSKVLLFFFITFHSLEIDFEISFQYFQHLFLPRHRSMQLFTMKVSQCRRSQKG